MRDPNTIALLGAGVMANAVAETLTRKGFHLRRYNRTPAAIRGGGTVYTTPARAAQGAGTIWSFVHDEAASRAVWCGPDGALSASGGASVIESSTVSPQYAQWWIDRAGQHGARGLHAPVTGSRPAALTASLVVFAGAGSADTRAAGHSILSAVAQEVVPVGSAAAAATVKVLNNALAAVILAGLAETITTATTLGLDTRQLVDVWSRHGWAAPVTSAYGSAMITGEHALTNCSLAVLRKDLRLVRALLGTTTPPQISMTALQLERAQAGGLGGQEMSAIIESIAGAA